MEDLPSENPIWHFLLDNISEYRHIKLRRISGSLFDIVRYQSLRTPPFRAVPRDLRAPHRRVGADGRTGGSPGSAALMVREMCQGACKPGSVPPTVSANADRIGGGSHSSRPRIASWLQQPTRILWGEAPCLLAKARDPYSALLRVGFAMRAALPKPRCALTAPFHPYPPAAPLRADGGTVCSLWHCPLGCPRRALPATLASWSPDFPRALARTRLPGPLAPLRLADFRHTAKHRSRLSGCGPRLGRAGAGTGAPGFRRRSRRRSCADASAAGTPPPPCARR